MNMVRVNLENTFVKIDWDAPTDNYDTISAYEIKIRIDDSTTDYYEELSYCDGSQQAIVTSLYCFIPMSVLWDPPYNLDRADSIIAIAKAKNSIGWADNYSSDNGAGTTVRTLPVQMADPTRGSLTSSTDIEVEWLALTLGSETGDSTILSYNLEWDAGSSGVSYVELVG
mmetsp:Transcript_29136/g.28195  ORF Transcript_29136/g.28195 Transcript_29136/m.28195 type:complete len:170 (-) Transcript_29136:3102-3611(-)